MATVTHRFLLASLFVLGCGGGGSNTDGTGDDASVDATPISGECIA